MKIHSCAFRFGPKSFGFSSSMFFVVNKILSISVARGEEEEGEGVKSIYMSLSFPKKRKRKDAGAAVAAVADARAREQHELRRAQAEIELQASVCLSDSVCTGVCECAYVCVCLLLLLSYLFNLSTLLPGRPGHNRTTCQAEQADRTDKGSNRPTALAPLLTEQQQEQWQQRSLSNLPVPFSVRSPQSRTLNRRPCGQQVAVAQRICIKIHLNKPSKKEKEEETERRGVELTKLQPSA